MNTVILFPSDSSNKNKADFAFEDEAKAAVNAGFGVAFFNQGVHFGADPEFAKLPEEQSQIIYRGWILSGDNYDRLDDALMAKGHKFVTRSSNYITGTNLPEWYPALSTLTPRSFWIKDGVETPEGVARYVRNMTYGQPLILKDYLKSRKHEWNDACYIPDSWDTENVTRVIKNFLELQGDCLQGGLVFRDYIKFKELGKHPKSGTPIIHEVRQYYYGDAWRSDATPFFRSNYWPELDKDVEVPPDHFIASVGKKCAYRMSFFVVDFGLTEAGHWIPIEVNDGGSAGLPNMEDAAEFYRALKKVSS